MSKIREKHTVMIVEDHPLIVEGITNLFHSCDDIDLVAVCESPSHVMELYAGYKPSVVLLDIKYRKQERTGLDICKDLLGKDPEAKIVFLSQFDQEVLITEAYKIGGLAYIMKDEDTATEVPAAIRAAARGEKYFSQLTSQRLASFSVDSSNITSLLDGEELQYFRLFALVLKREEIAGRMNVSLKTVTNKRKLLEQKTGISTDWGFVQAATKAGLIDPYSEENSQTTET